MPLPLDMSCGDDGADEWDDCDWQEVDDGKGRLVRALLPVTPPSPANPAGPHAPGNPAGPCPASDPAAATAPGATTAPAAGVVGADGLTYTVACRNGLCHQDGQRCQRIAVPGGPENQSKELQAHWVDFGTDRCQPPEVVSAVCCCPALLWCCPSSRCLSLPGRAAPRCVNCVILTRACSNAVGDAVIKLAGQGARTQADTASGRAAGGPADAVAKTKRVTKARGKPFTLPLKAISQVGPVLACLRRVCLRNLPPTPPPPHPAQLDNFFGPFGNSGIAAGSFWAGRLAAANADDRPGVERVVRQLLAYYNAGTVRIP